MRDMAKSRLLITGAVLLISCLLWLTGLWQSPLFHPELLQINRIEKRRIEQLDPALESERQLAEAYWQRYSDVRRSPFYGQDGVRGIHGPREHYESYGRQEGRVFALLPIPLDQNEEAQFAESYWQRYADVEKSKVWGRNGTLGVLGPRDHYTHIGKKQNRRWGLDEPTADGAAE